MSRYKIWDGKESIFTPVGEELTAEQWSARYKWAKIPGVKMIIGGGAINGSVAMEFGATVEHYKKQGCAINESMSDTEILQAIEAFEDASSVDQTEPDVTERMVALEEYKAMVELEGYQPSKAIIQKNVERGLWTESMVDVAVTKGVVSAAEKLAIFPSDPIISQKR
jgi:hypothetical protein